MAKQAKVWTGSAWADLASATTDLTPYSTTAQMNTAIDVGSGSKLITTQTISSSISAVNFDNCFTSTYQNYLIVLNVTVSGYTNITFKYRTGGSSISTNYTNGSLTATTGASVTNYAGGETATFYLGRSDTSKKISSFINVFNPLQTGIKQQFFASNGDVAYYAGGGNNTNAGSMDGFSIIGESFNLTGGTIRVYGYKNS
jgi:hypothetical protein